MTDTHYAEQNKSGIKTYTLYDYIYLKFQNSEIYIYHCLPGAGDSVEVLTTKKYKGPFQGYRNILYFDHCDVYTGESVVKTYATIS